MLLERGHVLQLHGFQGDFFMGCSYRMVVALDEYTSGDYR